ncbi:hypothetical protein D5S17_33900 [Pseudonocardiaceae bacterium YIM PH 21723]|nr:hypothetical protein D5S17_33900 [Pseudonocardiaceae bacterium YIM PH 21723]
MAQLTDQRKADGEEVSDEATVAETDAVTTTEEPQTATSEQVDEPQKPKRTLFSTRNLVAFGALLVLLATVLFLGYQTYQANHTERLRSEALAVGNEVAVDLGTYDYKDPKAFGKKTLSMSTESFSKAVNDLQGDITQALSAAQGTSKGKVVGIGVGSLNEEKAQVLVFLNMEVTNNVTAQQGRVDPSRMIFDLVRQDGAWKLDRIQAV